MFCCCLRVVSCAGGTCVLCAVPGEAEVEEGGREGGREEGEGRREDGLKVPLLGTSPVGIREEEEEEEEWEEEGEEAAVAVERDLEKGNRKVEEGEGGREGLTWEDLRRRTASLPAGEGGRLLFREVGYRVMCQREGGREGGREEKRAGEGGGGGGGGEGGGDEEEQEQLLQKSNRKSSSSSSSSKNKKKELILLQGGVTGAVAAGGMLALMGPSGAGKTTLLDVLAGRKTQGTITGQVVWESGQQQRQQEQQQEEEEGGGEGGRKGGRRRRRGRCAFAYVTQDDVHLSQLTVRETLWFAALLRMEEGVGREGRRARVEAMEEILGLSEARNTIVGDVYKKGLSGGQRRRLSIGVEIIDLPSLIFADEITTGLDASTAMEVMGLVRGLCDAGRVGIVTIHQPSMEVINLFDSMLVLAEGGRMIYQGPVQGLIGYFAGDPLRLGLGRGGGKEGGREGGKAGGFGKEEGGGGDGGGNAAAAAAVINPADFAMRVAAFSSTCASLPPSSSSLPPSSPFASPFASRNNSSQNLCRLPSSNNLLLHPSTPSSLTSSLPPSSLSLYTPSALASAFASSPLGLTLLLHTVPPSSELALLPSLLPQSSSSSPSSLPPSLPPSYPRTLLSQIGILNHRQFLKITKDKKTLLLNNLNYLFLGFFWGTLFAGKKEGQTNEGGGEGGQVDLQTSVGLLYSSVCIVSFSNQNVMPALYESRPLFYRERGAGVVRTLAFCFALDTPYLVINATTSIFFSLLLHLLTPLRPGLDSFLFYSFSLLLMSWTSLSLIVFLSSTLPSIRELSSIWSFLGYVITVAAGFMARVPSMPTWADWATLLWYVALLSSLPPSLPPYSWARWGFQGLATSELKGRHDGGNNDILTRPSLPPSPSLPPPAGLAGVFKDWPSPN